MTLWEVFFPDSGVVMVEWLTPKEIERIEFWERHGSPESKSEQDRFFLAHVRSCLLPQAFIFLSAGEVVGAEEYAMTEEELKRVPPAGAHWVRYGDKVANKRRVEVFINHEWKCCVSEKTARVGSLEASTV